MPPKLKSTGRAAATRPPRPARAGWPAAGARFSAALARPLPDFAFERGLSRLAPAWMLLGASVGLLLLFALAAADLPDNPGPAASWLPFLGLAGVVVGLAGLRYARAL